MKFTDAAQNLVLVGGRGPEKHICPLPLVSVVSRITAKECGFTPPLNSEHIGARKSSGQAR